MAKIPDKAEHQRRFTALETRERRAIIKAVNRGQALDDRKHAMLAVGVARRQARFWRVAWLLGPVVGLTGLFGTSDLQLTLINAAVATVALGLMSWFWYSRARRAEERNLEVALGRRGHDRERGTEDEPGRSGGRRLRAHLPGSSSNGDAAAGGAAPRDGRPERAGDEPAPPPVPGQRPYRPRGRKRR